MPKLNRVGTTLTALGLVTALAACSTAGQQSARNNTSAFGGKVDVKGRGTATQALIALNGSNIPQAIQLAETAVNNSPQDAGFRALLGNCYLAAGRFGSAEEAFTDSLSLAPNQPQVILKLALVQIALGKGEQGAELLRSAQDVLDASDVGLALALAGRSEQAVALLEAAARQPGADGRVRQNLALAYGMSGNWDAARTVASQDVPGDQLDARIKQFMSFATPGRAGTQVAAMIGVNPVASDPGQPTRLALNKASADQRLAAAPVIVPAPMVQPVVEVAAVELPVAPTAAPTVSDAVVEMAEVAPSPAPIAPVAQAPAPVKVAEIAPAPAPVVKTAAKPVKLAVAKPKPVKVAKAPIARPALSPAAQLMRPAAVRSGNAGVVVQLGAYSSRDRLSGAWSKATAKFGSLRGYTPTAARFDSVTGPVYRLGVKGFASQKDAQALCRSIKASGGTCFVRGTSGDAPVQLAMR